MQLRKDRLNPHALALLATVLLVLLTAAAYAGSNKQPLSAAQIADRLDSVVQPRFHLDEGMFGEERAVNGPVDGHRQVDFPPHALPGSHINPKYLSNEGREEYYKLRPVASAPYFVILGLMHVRHKPGSHIDAHDAKELIHDFKPSATPLVASGTDDNRAERTYTWAQNNMGPATMWAYKQVRRGVAMNSTYHQFYVAIRPVKADRRECVSCHVGAHIGDTLGALVYMIAPTPNHKPAPSTAYSGVGTVRDSAG